MIRVLVAIIMAMFLVNVDASVVVTMDRDAFISGTQGYQKVHHDFEGRSHGESLNDPFVRVHQPGVGWNSGRIVNMDGKGYLGRTDPLGNIEPFNMQQILNISYFPNVNIKGVGCTIKIPDVYGQEFNPTDIEIDLYGVHINLPETDLIGDIEGTFFAAYNLDASYRSVNIRFRNEAAMGWIDELFIIIDVPVDIKSVNEPMPLLLIVVGLLLIIAINNRGGK